MRLKYPYAKHKLNQHDIRAAIKALKSDVLSRGKATQQLEEKLCEATGASYAVAVSSGTAALHSAYLALDKPRDTTFFTSPITFASAVTTAVLSGYSPHFIDIEPKRPQIDVSALREFIKPNSIICPTALTGQSFNQAEIWGLAEQYQATVIADHSHSLGGIISINEKKYPMANADFADLATLSFQSTKLITGGGEGGAIITKNEKLFHRLLAIRSHGMIYEHEYFQHQNEGIHYHEMQFPGLNYRITEMQAALCLSQLNRKDELVEKRNEIANWYFQFLKNVQKITLPTVSDSLPAWHLFTIRVPHRNNVATALRKKSIGTQVHYLPVYRHPWYQKNGFTNGAPCKHAETYYEQTLSLPMHIHLRKKDVQYICEELIKTIESQ
ncbi:hypothetical protein EP331_08910 [bacterium]|nr:MAG: hypothetical protein EP331_08910 [bacterium]